MFPADSPDSLAATSLDDMQGSEKMEIPTEPVVVRSLPAPKTFFELVNSRESSPKFNLKRLSVFLKQFAVFPSEHRVLIWRYILNVPENFDSYEAYMAKGTHPSFADFRRRFPIKSDRMAKSMEKYPCLHANRYVMIGYCPFLHTGPPYSRTWIIFPRWFSRLSRSFPVTCLPVQK